MNSFEALVAQQIWMRQAACRGRSDLYFSPQFEKPSERTAREQQARSLCRGCAVLDTCRSFARDHREYGLWGDESEEERSRQGFAPSVLAGAAAANRIKMLAQGRTASGRRRRPSRRKAAAARHLAVSGAESVVHAGGEHAHAPTGTSG